ncbi:unnamed protein product [Closterium sp. Yama58-4]|nr:unnamed protein product [Closterium sp. Yama58-4]
MLRALELWELLDIKHMGPLKVTLAAEGVVKLIAGDDDLRWKLAGLERARELGVLARIVCMLGKRCSDVRLHGLPQRLADLQAQSAGPNALIFHPKEEAFLLKYLEEMVAATSTLHLEMTTLDNLLPSSHPLRLSRMVREGLARSGSLGVGALSQDRIQGQMKLVERLQKESLWCEDFDKSVLLLAAAVVILSRRLRLLFGSPEVDAQHTAHTLGERGLALHYAHTLLLVERIVNKPTALLRVQRDDLYRRLPGNVKHQLRVRLNQRPRPFDIEAAAEIRRTLEYMLGWLLPMAHATITWQTEHSYGCHLSKRHRTLQVQTLYYADKDRFEVCLVELLVGLSYISRPPGLTNLQPGEEAPWRLWLTTGGHIPPVGADGRVGKDRGRGRGDGRGRGGEVGSDGKGSRSGVEGSADRAGDRAVQGGMVGEAAVGRRAGGRGTGGEQGAEPMKQGDRGGGGGAGDGDGGEFEGRSRGCAVGAGACAERGGDGKREGQVSGEGAACGEGAGRAAGEGGGGEGTSAEAREGGTVADYATTAGGAVGDVGVDGKSGTDGNDAGDENGREKPLGVLAANAAAMAPAAAVTESSEPPAAAAGAARGATCQQVAGVGEAEDSAALARKGSNEEEVHSSGGVEGEEASAGGLGGDGRTGGDVGLGKSEEGGDRDGSEEKGG